MEIRCTSLKQLYADLRHAGNAVPDAAVVCSSYPIWEDALGCLQSRLTLDFDDVENPRGRRAFTPAMALEVARFVRALPPDAASLRVCCDGGRSRSAALTAAILRYLGLSDARIWGDARYSPNTLVYCLQCEAFGVRVGWLALHWRQWRNRRANSIAYKERVVKHGHQG